jgi:diguanylate cyclase (GGDEF)-like protein
MDNPIDLQTDWLAGAALAPEQKSIWNKVRAELASARLRLQELELQVKTLERRAKDDDNPRNVLTRPEFNREVARMLAFDERYGGMSSVLYFDFENFNEITKLLGNAAGNEAIRCICDTLSKNIRTSDILGRLATNEFGIMLVRCDSPSAWKKGELIATKLQEVLLTVCDNKITPAVNYGAYTFRENEDVSGGLKNAASAVTRSGTDAVNA